MSNKKFVYNEWAEIWFFALPNNLDKYDLIIDILLRCSIRIYYAMQALKVRKMLRIWTSKKAMHSLDDRFKQRYVIHHFYRLFLLFVLFFCGHMCMPFSCYTYVSVHCKRSVVLDPLFFSMHFINAFPHRNHPIWTGIKDRER